MTRPQILSLARTAVNGAKHPSPSVAMAQCPIFNCREWIAGHGVRHPSGVSTADRALLHALTEHLEQCCKTKAAS